MSTYSTRVLPLADPVAQQEALTLLDQEQIFAAPTDTVYGLFARPDSPAAIERIYLAKARPPEKAIPILIGALAHLAQVACPPLSPLAAPLMANFWPGALTLVLPAQAHLPAILTAGQPTVAVRMPSHATLCALLQRTGPLAATSANRSGGADTHSASEVFEQLNGCIPLILSDESLISQQSLPSTLVDLTDPSGPRILRQGQLFAEVSALLATFVNALWSPLMVPEMRPEKLHKMLFGVDASRALRAQRTGTERYALEIIQHLLALPQARHHQWRLYMDHQPTGDEAWASDSLPSHAELCVLPARRMWTHRALAAEIHARPPTVLFVPSHVLPLVSPPRRLPPSVVTVHDLGYHYFPAAHLWRQRLYVDWGTRWSVAAATAVIAISQATANDLQQVMGTSAAKIHVVHEAANALPMPTPEAIAALRAQFGLARPYALYVGTLQPRKNLARLISAYEHLLQQDEVAFDLVLAGKAGWLSDEIVAQARQSPHAERIHLPGYVADDQLPALMAGATFFTFPSLYEGFGLPILEAQSLGVPVMTASASSLPEVAGDAALYVDPTDVEAIAQAMLRLSQDENLREELIAAGYRNVQRFSWEKAATETLAVLEEAARQGK